MREPHAALEPLVYEHLHHLAARWVRDRRQGDHFAPSSLVHDAWIKLARNDGTYENRGHFLAVACKAMRQVLSDRAKALRRDKRGGDLERVSLSGLGTSADPVDALALEQALLDLEATEPRLVRVVELRCFADLSHTEIADILGVTSRTVDMDWRKARAWLTTALSTTRT
jgi:RNA polymerase sigma factor (TIGR02999 family)